MRRGADAPIRVRKTPWLRLFGSNRCGRLVPVVPSQLRFSCTSPPPRLHNERRRRGEGRRHRRGVRSYLYTWVIGARHVIHYDELPNVEIIILGARARVSITTRNKSAPPVPVPSGPDGSDSQLRVVCPGRKSLSLSFLFLFRF